MYLLELGRWDASERENLDNGNSFFEFKAGAGKPHGPGAYATLH